MCEKQFLLWIMYFFYEEILCFNENILLVWKKFHLEKITFLLNYFLSSTTGYAGHSWVCSAGQRLVWCKVRVYLSHMNINWYFLGRAGKFWFFLQHREEEGNYWFINFTNISCNFSVFQLSFVYTVLRTFFYDLKVFLKWRWLRRGWLNFIPKNLLLMFSRPLETIKYGRLFLKLV